MAIAVVGTGAQVSGSGTLNVPLAAGSAGDVCVICLLVTTNGEVTAPAGWTMFATLTPNIELRNVGLLRAMDGTEGTSVAVTVPATSLARSRRHSGVDNGTPLDVPVTTDVNTSNSGTCDLPALDAGAAGRALLVGAGLARDNETGSVPAGWELFGQFNSTVSGVMADKLGQDGSAEGVTVTWSDTRRCAGWLIALRPASSGTPTTTAPAGTASASAAAGAATSSTAPTAQQATATAAALDGTVRTGVTAVATPASSTASATSGSPRAAPGAAAAGGSGTAPGPQARSIGSAAAAAGSGTVNPHGAQVAATAIGAVGAAEVQGPGAGAAPTAGSSTGSGSGLDAAASTSGATIAPAATAGGSGTTYQPAAGLAATAPAAAAAAAALDAAVSTSTAVVAPALAALGSSEAGLAAPTAVGSAGAATAAGSAFDGTARTAVATTAPAGAAAGSGTAAGPAGQVAARAEPATGAGEAPAAVFQLGATRGHITAAPHTVPVMTAAHRDGPAVATATRTAAQSHPADRDVATMRG